jgi:hypothetical protein
MNARLGSIKMLCINFMSFMIGLAFEHILSISNQRPRWIQANLIHETCFRFVVIDSCERYIDVEIASHMG